MDLNCSLCGITLDETQTLLVIDNRVVCFSCYIAFSKDKEVKDERKTGSKKTERREG